MGWRDKFYIHGGSVELRQRVFASRKHIFFAWQRDPSERPPPRWHPCPWDAKQVSFLGLQAVVAAAHIAALLDRLLMGLSQNPTKSFVLGEYKSTFADFKLADSEKRDGACRYIENIMDILGIESSDGLLGQWRCGFDLGANI